MRRFYIEKRAAGTYEYFENTAALPGVIRPGFNHSYDILDARGTLKYYSIVSFFGGYDVYNARTNKKVFMLNQSGRFYDVYDAMNRKIGLVKPSSTGYIYEIF